MPSGTTTASVGTSVVSENGACQLYGVVEQQCAALGTGGLEPLFPDDALRGPDRPLAGRVDEVRSHLTGLVLRAVGDAEEHCRSPCITAHGRDEGDRRCLDEQESDAADAAPGSGLGALS